MKMLAIKPAAAAHMRVAITVFDRADSMTSPNIR